MPYVIIMRHLQVSGPHRLYSHNIRILTDEEADARMEQGESLVHVPACVLAAWQAHLDQYEVYATMWAALQDNLKP
jgi:hypothetical protein